MRAKRTLIAVVIVLACAGEVPAVDLKELLQNPAAYHNQRVAVTGIARTTDDCYLFEEISAAAQIDRSKGVYVVEPTTGPDSFALDRQWVSIVGKVDATAHGRGSSPCEIVPERIQRLVDRAMPRIRDSTVYGIFNNSTLNQIRVELLIHGQSHYAELWIAPHKCGQVAIHSGEVRAFRLSNRQGVQPWRQSDAELIATGKINIPKLADTYEYSAADSDERTLYYRVARGEIRAVSATAAKTCKQE